ncbi:hypothetical protein HYT57_03455 [Candidatus Woesearchaeota archaeon]|nr:hypothetical protein [Candidatus Woesearchaeota archaeon]
MVNVTDPSAGNAPRIVAELRRFGARIVGHTPREIRVTPEIVRVYCKYHNIEHLEEPFLIATGLKKPEESELGLVASQLAANDLKPNFYKMSGRVNRDTAHS